MSRIERFFKKRKLSSTAQFLRKFTMFGCHWPLLPATFLVIIVFAFATNLFQPIVGSFNWIPTTIPFFVWWLQFLVFFESLKTASIQNDRHFKRFPIKVEEKEVSNSTNQLHSAQHKQRECDVRFTLNWNTHKHLCFSLALTRSFSLRLVLSAPLVCFEWFLKNANEFCCVFVWKVSKSDLCRLFLCKISAIR